MSLPFFVPDSEQDISIKLEPCTTPLDEQQASTLLESRKDTRSTPMEISQILDVDSKILSYGQFTSGRVLGSTVTLTNKSSKAQTFTVHIASDFPKNQSPQQMLDQYYQEDLPFRQSVSDVENLYKCWSIEQPQTKQLSSKITVELEPQES